MNCRVSLTHDAGIELFRAWFFRHRHVVLETRLRDECFVPANEFRHHTTTGDQMRRRMGTFSEKWQPARIRTLALALTCGIVAGAGMTLIDWGGAHADAAMPD